VFCPASVMIAVVAVLFVELRMRRASGGGAAAASVRRPSEDAPRDGAGTAPEPAGDGGDDSADQVARTGPPVYVECPRCVTINEVTTAERPHEFRCRKCSALLRLSK